MPRFYLDEDLPTAAAVAARALGLDAISSHECGRDGLADDIQLRLAAAEGRCFVTRNRDDFFRLTTQLFDEQAPHLGVLIVPRSLPNRDLSGIARALVERHRAQPGDFPSYTADYLRPAAGG